MFRRYHRREARGSKGPDFTNFSDSEIKILATVRERFKEFSSRKIMEYSHNEVWDIKRLRKGNLFRTSMQRLQE